MYGRVCHVCSIGCLLVVIALLDVKFLVAIALVLVTDAAEDSSRQCTAAVGIVLWFFTVGLHFYRSKSFGRCRMRHVMIPSCAYVPGGTESITLIE